MQPPPRKEPGIVEKLSQPAVILLRYLFFVLIFFLLFSILAGLFLPGKEYGRFAFLTEALQTCEDLERDLAPYNVNAVEYRVEPAAGEEFPDAVNGGQVCWLELAGVSETEGVSADSAPVYSAARDLTEELLAEEEPFYVPRYGRQETMTIWLLSFLLGAVVLFLRMRPKRQVEDE